MKSYMYTVLLERLGPEKYRAICPTFPGCRARGATQNEVIQNIKLSIHHRLDAFIAEGKPVPMDGDAEVRYVLRNAV